MIPEQVNVPYERLLLGINADDNMYGSRGQESFEQPSAPGSADAPVGQQVFNLVPGPIKAALAGPRSKYPMIWVSEIMGAVTPPIKYTVIKLGPMGACLDMLCLGICKEVSCPYKHPLTGISIDPSRAAGTGDVSKKQCTN